MTATNPTRRNSFYWLSRVLVILIGSLAYRRPGKRPRHPPRMNQIRLAIAAGPRGWELIEYQELHRSAAEYFGAPHVVKLEVTPGRSITSLLKEFIETERPTHYYFDPRSGSQAPLKGIWESLQIGKILNRAGVTPICALTDFPVRVWRLQCAIVSARHGVVTTLMDPALALDFFPHSRLIGPMPFSLSRATLIELQARRGGTQGKRSGRTRDVAFIGSLYEPRKTTIDLISSGLGKRGIPVAMLSRNSEGLRFSNEEYWSTLQETRIVLSTSSQISGTHTDFDHSNHLIYRFLEVTAAGSVLAIQPAPGVEQFFTPDVDFISYRTPDEAIEKIAMALSRPGALEEMARCGFEKARGIVESHYFWSTVIAALENHAWVQPTTSEPA